MKVDTNIFDELINNAPIIDFNSNFYISSIYTDYPKKYKGHNVIVTDEIKDNSFYFGNFKPIK